MGLDAGKTIRGVRGCVICSRPGHSEGHGEVSSSVLDTRSSRIAMK